VADGASASALRVWPLVGRDDELQSIASALDDPGCHGLALVGPAGVGKTRLARAAAELGSSRGMTAVTIRATPTAAELPFAALTPLFLELRVDPTHTEWPVHALADAIARSGPRRHLVLVIDDAPDLDGSSRAVVDQLVGTPGVFLVLTAREGLDDAATGLGLWKDDRISRMRIFELGWNDLSALVQVGLDGPVDGATLRALSDASRGNLLMLRELILGSLESGVLTSQHGIWRLNGSLADSPRLTALIDHRLRAVPEASRQALELIALGEPLVLGRLRDLVPGDAVEVLEREGVVESVSEKGDVEVRMTHPLYAEVVRSQLSPARRVHLYGLLADAVEAAGSPGSEQSLRVAVWRLECGGADPVRTVAAAGTAFDLEDFSLAARLARAAWESSGAVAAAILLADSLDRLGRSEELEQVIRAAYPKANTDAEVTALAVRYASALYRWVDRTDEADGVLLEAAARVTDPSCRRTIDAQRGGLFLRSGQVVRAIELEAPLVSDPGDAAFLQASLNLGVALPLAGRGEEAIRHLDALAAGGMDRTNLPAFWADTWTLARVYSLVETGGLAEAYTEAQSAYGFALDRGHATGLAWAGIFLGIVLGLQGDLRGAEGKLREASAFFAEMHHPGERWALGCVALVAGQMGRSTVARQAVDALEAVPASAWSMMDVYEWRGRAWAAVADGDLATATATLWELVELCEEGGQLGPLAAALHDLLRVSGEREAAVRLERLADRVEGPLMDARVAYAVAQLGADAELAGAAADGFERCGALLFAAEAAALEHRLAERAGLRRRAAEAGRRATRLAARCDGAHTPAIATVEGPQEQLSGREREIAQLAAQGLSNREIADKLVLSRRTVENHLQRVYTKLAVTSRGQLVAALGADRPG